MNNKVITAYKGFDKEFWRNIEGFNGMLSNESIKLKTNEEAAIFSVNIADALVNELKGE